MDKILIGLLGLLVWMVPAAGEAARSAPVPATSSKGIAKAGALKAPPAPKAKTATEATETAAAARSAPAYQLYTYFGDRYRDPFVPLNNQYRNESDVDRPPQIASLLLKGIVGDEKGRMALLTSGVSSYVLRGGRLYDGRNHQMKGISGVIKTNSVVLMGSDRTIKELKVVPTL
jgi:hypothetical protein